ncbi:hypothetical protein HaLaN_01853 [Haematococcus lacustris]|uniref:Uncharacterized protein n=1 Tax=Haematococcus lacustris TaxID=44745 RepID=A0A699YAB9_HAELA|nr:hypothetical protein HaLaN_01853 [Haematococcus lacustris]
MEDRAQLVGDAVGDLHAAISTAQSLFKVASNAPDQSMSSIEMKRAAYFKCTQALRTKLSCLLAISEQEAVTARNEKPDDQAVAALQQRASELRTKVRDAAELEKSLIDQLRSMLDAMANWDNYKKQLDQVAGVPPPISRLPPQQQTRQQQAAGRGRWVVTPRAVPAAAGT